MPLHKVVGGLALVAFQPAMAYGLLMLASYWAGDARGAGSPVYVVLGIGAPMTAWIMMFVLPPMALVCPAALLALYVMLDGDEREARELREETARQQLEQASARLFERPDDGTAHLERAEVLEKAGRWQEALEAYTQAHRCSDMMLSAVHLAAIKARLEDAEQDARGEGVAALRSEQETLGERVEWVLLALSAPVALIQLYAAAALASVMLFLVWFRGYARRR